MEYYQLSTHKTFEDLASSPQGLTQEEVIKRQKKEGSNCLPPGKKVHALEIFLFQFKSPLIYILCLASLVTFILGDHVDAGVILVAIFINVTVGFFQEYKAHNELEKLKKVISLKSIVIREGHEQEIDANDLVAGDIIIFKAGDKIPADGRIVECRNLKINEASLTGESLPVDKINEIINDNVALGDQKNLVFMGTEVVEGWGKGVIYAIGAKTELGKIATLISETKETETPLQISLQRFSRDLSILILVICVGVFLAGLGLRLPFVQMFSLSVALAVAAIPEGLAVALTAILAIGMQRILQEHALVRKLLAAETLGSTTVICTDKTGTLTRGEMQVVKIFTNNEYTDAEKNISFEGVEGKKEEELIDLMEISVLCNDAFIENPQDELGEWVVRGNPTEKALLLAATQAGFYKEHVEKSMPRLDFIPFDSAHKYMSTLHSYSSKNNILLLKGAPEIIFHWCDQIRINDGTRAITHADKALIMREMATMAEEGLRVIGLGYKKIPLSRKEITDVAENHSEFTWVGLMGIKDPLRKEAKETLELCHTAGIRVVLVTGDYTKTAVSIMAELGFDLADEAVIDGEELRKLTDEELQKVIHKIRVFSRVTPADKIRIVTAFQTRGEVVAMTGDGINDAPALKKADVGIVVGSGTEVAKETADMVLLDDNFKTIVSAIKQGRTIFDNIKKVILYLLSDSFSEIVLVIGAMICGLPIPLTAAQILWINLITDGFPGVALTVEPADKEIMTQKPRNLKEQILSGDTKLMIIVISFFAGILNLLIFYFIYKQTGDIKLARSIVFVSSAIDSLFYVFSCRSLPLPIWKHDLFNNKALLVAVTGGFLFQLAAVYVPFLNRTFEVVPLNARQWLIPLAVALVTVVMIESVKYVMMSKKRAYS